MGDGEAEERHGTAEGCRDSSEETRDNKDTVAQRHRPHAEVLGILLAKDKNIERLHHKDGSHETDNRHETKNGEARDGDIRKRAQAPRHKGTDAVIGREEIEQGDDGRSHITEDDACDEQCGTASDDRGKEIHKECHGESPDESRNEYGDITLDAQCAEGDASPEEEHHESHAKPCPTAYAEERTVGKGVMEDGLEHQSADGEGTAAQECRDGLRQTEVEDDETRAVVHAAVAAYECGESLSNRDVNGSRQDIQ